MLRVSESVSEVGREGAVPVPSADFMIPQDSQVNNVSASSSGFSPGKNTPTTPITPTIGVNPMSTVGASPDLPMTGNKNPFALENIRIEQDFHLESESDSLDVAIPVVKATPPDLYIRANPEAEFCLTTRLIWRKSENTYHFVPRFLWDQLEGEPAFQIRRLFLTVSSQGKPMLVASRLPGPDGRFDEWGRSMLMAMEVAKERWVRIYADVKNGKYSYRVAKGALPDPQWPNMSMQEIIALAFKDRLIDTLDHVVLKMLRGETQ